MAPAARLNRVMSTKIRHLLALCVAIAAPVYTGSVLAQTTQAETQVRLMERLEALEQRVATLEATRTFAAFMPELAERFHVMHRAGDAGDWAVAAHELAEMKRLSRQSVSIDAEQGKLLLNMMAPSYQDLESAIGHGNGEKFSRALQTAIDACNGCHAATGSNFVEVTLDAPDGLSMRHPHRLMMRNAPAGHHHGQQGRHMTQGGHGGGHDHAPGTPEAHHHAPAQGGIKQP